VGLDSSVGIATTLGAGWSGVRIPVKANFPHPFRQTLGSTQLPLKWVPGLFPRVKGLERGVYHTSPSSTEVEGKVELYLYSPSVPLWQVIG
jgi:hypothetical protein